MSFLQARRLLGSLPVSALGRRALRTPTGPFGTAFPESYVEARAKAAAYMEAEGWECLVEQSIVWGHLDSFAHVNNARYITFFETGRMQFIQALLPELEPGSEDWLVKGKPGGPGVILGSISARYKRPVMFPDTLLVAHRVTDISRDRFQMEHICYSFAQQAVCTTGTCSMVMYDYGKMGKTDMTAEFKVALEKRMKH